MAKRITDRALLGLRPSQVIRDTELRGFAARMAPDGRVSFIVRREGANKIFKVIGHSDTLTAAKAREAAKKILARHVLGQSEIVGKKFTLDSAWPVWRADLERKGKSPKTIAAYNDALARLNPNVRATPLRALGADPSIMLDEHTRIAERPKETRARYRVKGHGLAAADSSARFVRALYNYMRRRHDATLPGSPTVDLNLEIKTPIHFVRVMKADDLADWWRAVARLENPIRQLCHLFCLLSGLRTESLIEMRWEHDAPEGFAFAFHIPKPKGGTRRAFDLVMSNQMMTCLDHVQALGYARYGVTHPERLAWVWPGSGDAGHLGGLENDKKYGVHAYGHALRRTYSSMAKAIGVDEELIGRLINHKGKTITAHYIRTTAIGKLLLELQNKISDHIIEQFGSGFKWPSVSITQSIPVPEHLRRQLLHRS